MGRRGRGSVAVAVETTVIVMNVSAGSGVVGILIDGILHLAQNVVNVDEILLGASVGHGQVVLLS